MKKLEKGMFIDLYEASSNSGLFYSRQEGLIFNT